MNDDRLGYWFEGVTTVDLYRHFVDGLHERDKGVGAVLYVVPAICCSIYPLFQRGVVAVAQVPLTHRYKPEDPAERHAGVLYHFGNNSQIAIRELENSAEEVLNAHSSTVFRHRVVIEAHIRYDLAWDAQTGDYYWTRLPGGERGFALIGKEPPKV